MDTVERVKKICKARHISILKLETGCGFGNGYIRNLKKGTFPQDRLLKISTFLGLPMDYLLGIKDEYGLIPEDWDMIGMQFMRFCVANRREISIIAQDTGIKEDRIRDFFEAGIPVTGLELLAICRSLNVPMDKVIPGYADAFNKKSPSEDGVTEEQIKFALAGDAGRVLTDEDMEKIRAFAAFTAQERGKK